MSENVKKEHDSLLFDPAEILAGSAQACVDVYKEQFKQGSTKAKGLHRKLKDPGRQAERFSNERITSYRAACVAADESVSKITYNKIARMHNIPPSWAAMLRRDWTKRPTCIPTTEQIDAFKEQFDLGETQVRYMKASNPSNKLDPKKVQAVSRARKALKWTSLMKFFKRSFGELPEDQITALVMLEELYSKQCMTKETACEAVILIQQQLPAMKALKVNEE